MHMGHSNEGAGYHLDEEEIPHDTEEEDLGVIITEDGKTRKQCAEATTKAMTKLRIIKRGLKSGLYMHYGSRCRVRRSYKYCHKKNKQTNKLKKNKTKQNKNKQTKKQKTKNIMLLNFKIV